MTHLTVEEMINFVSFDKISNETTALASKVNSHICSCGECFEKVAAFQDVYDELCRIGTVNNARKCIYAIVDDAELERLNACELAEALKNEVNAEYKDTIF